MVKAIRRAKPETRTRNQHPKCATCPQEAQYTVEMADKDGSVFFDYCGPHLFAQITQEPSVPGKVLFFLFTERAK